MIKMFQYLKKSAGYIPVIFILLFIQANSDLALPSYTSKIVDVGIQQKGIEDAVPDKIRKESLDSLLLLMNSKEQEKVMDAYSLKGDMYELNKIEKETREDINIPLGEAMLMAAGIQEQGIDMSTVPKEQLEQMLSQAKEKVEEMPSSIVTQAATSFIQQEYKDQGQDVDKVQTRYVLTAGLKMLGLAAIGMAAAISVTFLSSRVAAGLGRDLRSNVYKKVISFSSSEMNKFSTASLITRSTNDIQQVQMFMTVPIYS